MDRKIWKSRLKMYGFNEIDVIESYSDDVINVEKTWVGNIYNKSHTKVYMRKGIVYLESGIS